MIGSTRTTTPIFALAGLLALPAIASAHPHGKKQRKGKHHFLWSFSGGGGVLGVHVQGMTPELRVFFGAPKDEGVLVVSVEEDGPAAKAGLAVGDVVVAVDGDPVAATWDLVSAISPKKDGDEVQIDVFRKHRRQSLAVKVEVAQDAGFQMPDFKGWQGPRGLPDFFWHDPEAGPGLPDKLRDKLKRLEKRLDKLERRL